MIINSNFTGDQSEAIFDKFQKRSGSPSNIVVFHETDLSDPVQSPVFLGTLKVQMTNKAAWKLLIITILKIVGSLGVALCFESIKNDYRAGKTRLLKENLFIISANLSDNHRNATTIKDVQSGMQEVINKIEDECFKNIHEALRKIVASCLANQQKEIGAIIATFLVKTSWTGISNYLEDIVAQAPPAQQAVARSAVEDVKEKACPFLKEFFDGIYAATRP